jgi:hypothetical protein
MYPEGPPFLSVGSTHQGEVMVATDAALLDGYTVPAMCSCGQDLDCCERAHCPRCGCEIHRAA